MSVVIKVTFLLCATLIFSIGLMAAGLKTLRDRRQP